jgi:penicillin amidase
MSAYGVSIPGTPVVVIGFNKYLGWTLTDVQAQMAYFYFLNIGTNGTYYVDNVPHRFERVTYRIALPNGTDVEFTVNRTVLGPSICRGDVCIAMNWTGDEPSDDVGVLLGLMRARNFTEFWGALSKWYSPPQNFVYADIYGNVAAVSAGLYPVISRGFPGMLLPPSGSSMVSSYIPYYEIPQTFDPPRGYIVASNQRIVGYNYPFYIGTYWDFFSTSFRAYAQAYLINQTTRVDPTYLMHVQWSDLDYSTRYFLPAIIKAIDLYGNNDTVMREIRSIFSSWDGYMRVNETAPTIYFFLIRNYVNDTFYPWIIHYGLDPGAFTDLVGIRDGGYLTGTLANLTLNDPYSPWFSDPINHRERNAYQVIILALNQTIQYLRSIML